MREIRLSGSEGGGTKPIVTPYPYTGLTNSHAEFIYKPPLPFVFSTKNRESLITAERRPGLYEYMGGTIRSLGGISLEINGMSDHVHLLSRLRPDESVSNAIRSLKANASGWMHKVFPELSDFKWQDGYGGFTVSQSQVEQVRK